MIFVCDIVPCLGDMSMPPFSYLHLMSGFMSAKLMSWCEAVWLLLEAR